MKDSDNEDESYKRPVWIQFCDAYDRNKKTAVVAESEEEYKKLMDYVNSKTLQYWVFEKHTAQKAADLKKANQSLPEGVSAVSVDEFIDNEQKKDAVVQDIQKQYDLDKERRHRLLEKGSHHKKMTKEELAAVLNKHAAWLKARTDVGGEIDGLDDMTNNDFGDADLRGADLRNADLSCVNFSHADLRWTKLAGSSLSEAKLCFANLTGSSLGAADLSGADLTDATLAGAWLRFANLRNADFTNADFSGANIDETLLNGAIFNGAKFRYIRGGNLKFIGNSLRGVDFTHALLSCTDFSNSDLTGSDFGNTSANANFSYANFANANLHGVKHLVGADSTVGAILNGANFSDATIDVAEKDILSEGGCFDPEKRLAAMNNRFNKRIAELDKEYDQEFAEKRSIRKTKLDCSLYEDKKKGGH